METSRIEMTCVKTKNENALYQKKDISNCFNDYFCDISKNLVIQITMPDDTELNSTNMKFPFSSYENELKDTSRIEIEDLHYSTLQDLTT